MENHERKSVRWILVFIISIFIFVTLCYFITKRFDPFYKYGKREHWDKYNIIKHERFIDVGLIRSFDYDTLLIGSSMVENWDMDYFREQLDCNAIKVPLSGLKISETVDLLNVATKVGKARKYYISLDVAKLANNDDKSRFSDYMLKDSFLADVKYSLNYESWYRYYPLNFMMNSFSKINLGITNKISEKWISLFGGDLDIDNKDNWSEYYVFDKETVLNNYYSGKYSVSKVELNNLYQRMCKKVDYLFESVHFDKEAEYNFFLPPYSILFWYDANKLGYFETYMKVQDYFMEKAKEYNIKVYNFQSAECILDLNNYKDTSHYSPEINNWMTDEFLGSKKYLYTKSYSYLIESLNNFSL
ncbi:MAG: hypothetical protein PT936_09700 [Treponema sp.]|nr:hypothetical protein [Treponema sp.]